MSEDQKSFTEIGPKDYIVKPEADSKVLYEKAIDAKQSAQQALDKYFNLVTYIRDAQFSPVEVNASLKEAGFSAPRIAEVKRVAFTSDAIFEDYRNRVSGFRVTLDRARSGDEDEVTQRNSSSSSEASEDEGGESGSEGSSPDSLPKKSAPKRKTHQQKIKEAFTAILEDELPVPSDKTPAKYFKEMDDGVSNYDSYNFDFKGKINGWEVAIIVARKVKVTRKPRATKSTKTQNKNK